jgi:hypothetical protein
VRDHPAGRPEPESLRRRIQIPDQGSTSDFGGARVRIHRHCPEEGQIDHDPSIAGGVARDAVATTSHGDLQAGPSCEPEGPRHVLSARTPRDHGRPLVHHRVPNEPRILVPKVLRRQELPAEAAPQFIECSGVDGRHEERSLLQILARVETAQPELGIPTHTPEEIRP